jgi:hypothetical protein
MSETPNDKTSSEAEKQNEAVRYGIYGDALKDAVKKSGQTVEFRALIKNRRMVDEKFPEKGSKIINTEVLISNQGTMDGEPKFFDGPHKHLIGDEIMVFVTEEDLAKLRIDLKNISLYADGIENFAKIDDKIRMEIAKRVSALMNSLPPPPISKRRYGHRF